MSIIPTFQSARFFLDIINYMLSGSVMGLLIQGDNAIEGMRLLIGATRVEDALPGTIRGDYALSTANNLIHGSDSTEAAAKEINRFFGMST